MNINQFAATHGCDQDYISIMAGRDVRALESGTRGTYAGLPCTVLRHYWNGMYEVRVPGGETCVSGSDIVVEVAA